MAVVVEVAGSDRFPTRPRIGANQFRRRFRWSRSFPRSRPGRLVFCHRMSEWPSSLKSPVPIAFQLGPGLGPTSSAADFVGPVHFPDRGLAVRVLPQDVGMAVVVEVARSDCFPTRPRIGADQSAADHVGPVHFPDRGLTASVLP